MNRKERERKRRIHEAHVAWSALAAFIVAYDAWAMSKSKVTLSQAVANGLLTRRGKYILFTIWIIISKHLLFGKFLPRLDPIGASASQFRKRAGVL